MVESALVQMGIGDIGERERRLPVHPAGRGSLVRRRIRDGYKLEGMRRHQALCDYGTRRGRHYFDERTPVEIAQRAQDAIALLHELRFNALVSRRHRRPPWKI